MSRQLFLLGTLLAIGLQGCSSRQTTSPSTMPGGRAQLEVFVEPNPIVARPVSGNTYDFPFEIGIRERGGVPVEIQRVGIEVIGLGIINLYSKTYGRDEIRRLGYPTSVGAHGEIRYRFNPRESVPDERLFGGVAAEIFVEGIDANGQAVRATARVTVSRQ